MPKKTESESKPMCAVVPRAWTPTGDEDDPAFRKLKLLASREDAERARRPGETIVKVGRGR